MSPRRIAAPAPPEFPDPAADAASLRTFSAIARLGAVGRAADSLGRSQPSVSARLASLEASWGVRLFRRRARGMDLTPEGARLLPLAEAALAALTAVDRAAGAGAPPPAELRVGAGDALGRELLPRTLGRLVRREPGLGVRVVEGSGARLLDLLEAGDLDMALIVLGEGARREGIRVKPFLRSPVEALFPSGDAPSTRVIDLEVLGARRVVALQQGSWFRRHVETAAASRGIVLRAAVEVGNLSLVRRFVAAGLGAGPVPSVAFRSGAPGPRVERRAIAGVPPVVYAVAEREGAPPRAQAAWLLDRLIEAGASAHPR